ncbi:MAG: MBL fold metallo-hydrolase, partial [Azospirillaceae bacterium]
MTGDTIAAMRLADLTVPAKGAAVEVAEGVFWLQMPLPMALNHVNLWALDDGDGWCLVDTGMATEEIKGLWQVLLDGPLAGRKVNRIICTHFHPDHAGLSGWLGRRTDAPVLMSEVEWSRAHFASTLPREAFINGQGTLFRENGLPGETLRRLAAKGNVFRGRVEPIVESVTPIGHGDTIRIGGRDWQVRTGSGHSPDHCCLWCEEAGLLITGDQILPKITPNVSVMWFGDDHDPLRQFIDSLRRFAWVPDEALALPGH